MEDTGIVVVGDWSPDQNRVVKNKLELYFLKKKSRGGECRVETVDGVARAEVYFTSREVRDRVLSKHNHEIILEQRAVQLQLSLDSAPANTANAPDAQRQKTEEKPQPHGAAQDQPVAPCGSCSVALGPVSEDTSTDLLTFLVENVCGLDENDFQLEIIWETNTAVVTFNDHRDADKFMLSSKSSKHLQKRGLSARLLEPATSVRVEGLPASAGEDLLELYFEKRWANPDKVVMIPEEQAAIVTFSDPKVVKDICSKTDVTIKSISVQVFPYYHSLGTVLMGKDRPEFKMPEPFTENVLLAVWNYLRNKNLSDKVNQMMRPYFCHVDLDRPQVKLSPLPSFSRQKNLTAERVQSWRDTALKAFRDHINEFCAFECPASSAAWKLAEKDVRAIVKDEVELNLDLSKGILTVAGPMESIKRIRGAVETAVSKAFNKIDREVNGVEEKMPLTPALFHILNHTGLKKAAQDISPDMTTAYNNGVLSMCGLTGEVFKLKTWILEKNMALGKKQINIPKSLQDFLQKVNITQLSQDFFTSQGICAFISIEPKGIFLMGSSEHFITEAEKKLQSALIVKALNIKDSEVLKMKQWLDLMKNLLETYNTTSKQTVQVQILQKIMIAGFANPVKEVSQALCGFINDYSRVQVAVKVKSCAVVQFIEKKKNDLWDSIAKDNEVNAEFDPEKPKFIISGSHVHVQKAKTSFLQLTHSLITDTLEVQKPGAKKYFMSQGALFLSTILSEFSCAVILRPEFQDDDDFEELFQVEDSVCSVRVRTQSGIEVLVRKADMCKLKVDAVVNAANDRLQHVGGLALALLNAAGPEMQRDCDSHIRQNGSLRSGNVFVTEGYKLPCKNVVHAVGPRYTDTDPKTAKFLLKLVVKESLKEAERLQCSSVAMPAISSGIFGFPVELCAETIAQAVREYCDDPQKQQGALNEVQLVDNNDRTVQVLASAVSREFADLQPTTAQSLQVAGAVGSLYGSGTIYDVIEYTGGESGFEKTAPNKRSAVSRPTPGPSGGSLDEWETFYEEIENTQGESGFYKPGPNKGSSTRRPKIRSAGGPERDTGIYEDIDTTRQDKPNLNKVSPLGRLKPAQRGQNLEQTTAEGVRISLVKGNIQEQTTDVIVNTMAENMILQQGAVSKALLQAAGQGLQAAVFSAASQSHLPCGEVVITDGFNLRCRKVFHAVCPPWDNGAGQAEEVLVSIVQLCLKEAEKLRMSSLTFPALGTGNLNFPRGMVSRLLLREVHQFSRKHQPQRLTSVCVVVHPSDTQTVHCFTREFKGQSPKGNVQSEPEFEQALVRSSGQSQQPSASFSQVSSPSLGVHQMHMGHVTLEISSGDITKEASDVIINSSNQNFTLKTGVSKAILDAAGRGVELECSNIVHSSGYRSRPMILTSAGQLLCKHIIHLVGQREPDAIKDMVYSVLKVCEENSFASVAFPALGTGAGGADPGLVADAMVGAVEDFVRKRHPKHVHSVKILVFQTAMIPEFHKSMMSRQGQPLEKGLMDKFKEFVSPLTSFFTLSSAIKDSPVLETQNIEPTVFELCAESQRAITQAKRRIEELILGEQAQRTISDPVLAFMTRPEVEKLQELQKNLTVQIRLDCTNEEEPVIHIEGLTRDVFTAESAVRDIIRKLERAENRKKQAFQLSGLVEWQYVKDDGDKTAFDIMTNLNLEEAWVKQKTVKIIINQQTFNAEPQRMRADSGHKTVELARRDCKGDVSVPSEWSNMKDNELVKLVKVDPKSKEFKKVEKELGRNGLTVNIISIERVQNPTLWKSYQLKKKELENKNKHKNNEQELFHGTDSKSIDLINKQGFNRSYAGTHAAVHGKGSYFAVDPAYSAGGYAQPDASSHKRMYLALVLVGDYTQGRGGMITPPVKGNPTELYDSVTDQMPTPTMFVIFNDVQAYPQYLITFT